MKLPDALVFMKVGAHAGESFDDIINRKMRERREAGCIFWGYGGTACHPVTQVRPFMSTTLEKNGSIYLFMETIDSKAKPQILPATQYSEDGKDWKPLPKGISVTGSKYALVLDEIKPGDLKIPLNHYEVAIGPSQGKRAVDYLTLHVDKACLVRRNQVEPSGDKVAKASFQAKLLSPYAVMVR